MSTIEEPNEREVRVAGYDLKKNPLECKKNIGVVMQDIALYIDTKLSTLNTFIIAMTDFKESISFYLFHCAYFKF